jgi:mannitol 2-dehydrogenase
MDMPRLPAPEYRARPLTPGIVHFGVGGFHRSHEAMYVHRLLQRGHGDEWAIVGVGTRPEDARMTEVLGEQDFLYVVDTRHQDGSSTAEVVGSILGHTMAADAPEEVLALLADPQVRIVSLTITEGGYHVDRASGRFVPDEDLRREIDSGGPVTSVFGMLTEGIAQRRAAGVPPFTVVSCDNIQDNGDVARAAAVGYAGMRSPELAAWIRDHVEFPSSMVDRITPVTTDEDVARVRDTYGWRDAWPVVAEPYTQWVLEDRFPAGRPRWEEVGVQMVPDVAPYERLKLRVLNGAHQALAYGGMLLGHTTVEEAVTDLDLRRWVGAYLTSEVVPTLDPVQGVDVAEYVESVLRRFANPAIGDTLERLATSATDRLSLFVLPVALERHDAGLQADRAIGICAMWWAAAVRAAAGDGTPVRDQVTIELAGRSTEPETFLEALPAVRSRPQLAASYLDACRVLLHDGVHAALEERPRSHEQ